MATHEHHRWWQRPPDAGPGITQGAQRALVFLFVLTLALSGANLVFTSFAVGRANQQQAQALGRATHNAATIAALCSASNEARRQQIILWDHLVVISAHPAHETVQARAQRVRTTRAFLAFIGKVFAPRNCKDPRKTEAP